MIYQISTYAIFRKHILSTNYLKTLLKTIYIFLLCFSLFHLLPGFGVKNLQCGPSRRKDTLQSVFSTYDFTSKPEIIKKVHFSGVEEMGDVILSEMLYRSNIIFIVRRSKDDTLLAYDDIKNEFVSEINFVSSIKAIRVRKDRCVF